MELHCFAIELSTTEHTLAQVLTVIPFETTRFDVLMKIKKEILAGGDSK